MYTIKHLVFVSLCLLCSRFCIAQTFPELKFGHLSTKDGLSSDQIRSILQDHRGIMWIATFDGLNRYDGTGFKIYRHSATDSASLPCNDIRDMVLDDENMLWIGTANGLCRFNTITGKAVSYYHNAKIVNTLAGNYDPSPFIDSRKRLWLATHAGVQLFNYKQHTFTTYNMPPTPNPNPGWEAHFNEFRIIREDVKGRLWATSFFGLFLIDEQQQKLIPYYQETFVANNSFFPLRDGNILLGQWGDGVKKFIPATNRYEKVQIRSATYNIVNGFEQWNDNNGHEWLCVILDEGLLLRAMNSGRFRFYKHDALNPFSLNAFTVEIVFKDPENRLWLGTDNGVSIIDPKLQYFNNHYLYQQVNVNNPKVFGLPRSLLETDTGYLLSCWFNKGLNYYDKNWKLLAHKDRIPENSSSFNSGSIYTIFRNTDGKIWFATDSGLVKMENGGYKVFVSPWAVSVLRGDFETRDILLRKDGLFWVRAKQNGLFLFDPLKGKFITQYKPNEKGLRGDVFSFCFDKKDNLWAGTDSGLFLFNEQKAIFENIQYKTASGYSNFEPVYDILHDDNNFIWAATSKGLGRINANTLTAELINEARGLPDNALYRIQEDTNRVLWLKSLRGIIRYDKGTGFQFFTSNNGLPDLYNSYGLFAFNRAGNIVSGHNGVLTEFNPYTIELNKKKPGIVLCDVYCDNKSSGFFSSNGRYSIIVQPGQKTLQVHFAIPSYTSSGSNKFFYKMPGIISEWIEVPNGNINFSSLPIGKHILYLKGSNNDGIFSDEQKVFVNVMPYWYQTNLFKIVTVLCIAALVFAFVRWQIRSIRKEASFKQKIAETEMQALRAQMNPHFIFNSLNSIENFIMQNEKRLASDYLNKFARLIRMILDSSRNELVPLLKDMEALQLYIDLEQLRFNNKFSYQSFIDPVLLNGDYRVPSLLIQPYVENAIVHGLANSEENDLNLSITVTLENDAIKYMIQDNGVGRKKANEYNLQNKPYHKSVGLQITEDRVNMFNHQAMGNNFIRFTDLYDENKEPGGTKVEIIIKAN